MTTATAYTVDWTLNIAAGKESGIYTASFKPAVAATGQPTVKRFGGVPFMGGTGGRGVWKSANDKVWARRRSGIVVPQRFKEAA